MSEVAIAELVKPPVCTPEAFETPLGTFTVFTNRGGRDDEQKYGPNQDRVGVVPEESFVCVVDGMGGMGKKGENEGVKAAAALGEVIVKGFGKAPMQELQRAASREMAARGVGEGGACYLALQVRKTDGQFWLDIDQAGDVRAVVFDSGDEPRAETKDQRIGKKVSNAVQGISPGDTTHSRIEVFPKDTVIVATDGLWDNVSPEKAGEILALHKDPQKAVQEIFKLAMERMRREKIPGQPGGKPDNITVGLFKLKPKPQEVRPEPIPPQRSTVVEETRMPQITLEGAQNFQELCAAVEQAGTFTVNGKEVPAQEVLQILAEVIDRHFTTTPYDLPKAVREAYLRLRVQAKL